MSLIGNLFFSERSHLRTHLRIFKELIRSNGNFPNNPSLPVLLYEAVMALPGGSDGDVVEKIFARNGWTNSWRDGIYTYHHYHSNTHEVLGVYSGTCKVLLGGEGGVLSSLEKGDILVIPAGVAHKNIESSPDFKCVGAYPDGREFDIRYGTEEERDKAEKNIARVPLPARDPLYGRRGPLGKFWGGAPSNTARVRGKLSG